MKKKNSDLAVALQYNEKHGVPRVIAKGRKYVAQGILEKADEEKIPIYKNQSVAEELMKLELGENIPEHLYPAVASILLFVYQLDEKRGKHEDNEQNNG